MKTRIVIPALYLLAIIFFSSNISYAQTGKTDSLAILSAKIDVLSDEIELLKNKIHGSSHETRPAFGLGPSAGRVYSSSNGVSVSGYAEMNYENNDSEKTDQIDFTRLVTYLGYHFSDQLLFNSEIEYEHASTGKGGEVSVEFAYLDFALKPDLSLRGGMLLIPVGIINEFHEPPTFFTSVRPMVERYIIPATWRGNGLGLNYSLDESVEFKLYLTEGLRAEKFSGFSGLRGGRQKGAKSVAENLALSGRVEYSGWIGNRIGISFYSGNSGQNFEDGNGDAIGARTSLISAHADLNNKQWHFRLLYAEASIQDAGRLNTTLKLADGKIIPKSMHGYYGTLAYDILIHSITLSPFVHYENLDLQASIPNGFSVQNLNKMQIRATGISFKVHPQTALKFEYRETEPDSGPSSTQFNIALGWMF